MNNKTSDDSAPATLNEHSTSGVEGKSTDPKPRGKRGAPKSNKNAIRHGLTCGQLPKGCTWVATLANELRKSLEDAVATAKGEISLYDAAIINSATRWERHAMLAQRWLRVETTLTIDQKLAFHREVARASTERDKCLKELGLHTSDTSGIIDALYSTAHEPDAEENADTECERAECNADTKHNNDSKATTEETTDDSHGDDRNDDAPDGNHAPEAGPHV